MYHKNKKTLFNKKKFKINLKYLFIYYDKIKCSKVKFMNSNMRVKNIYLIYI